MKIKLMIPMLIATGFFSAPSLSIACNGSGLDDHLASFTKLKQNPFLHIWTAIESNGKTLNINPEKDKERERLDILKNATPYVYGQTVLNGSECGLSLINRFKEVLLSERGGQTLVLQAFDLSGQRADNHNLLAGYIFRWENALLSAPSGKPAMAMWRSNTGFTKDGKSYTIFLDEVSVYDDSKEKVDFYTTPILISTPKDIINSAVKKDGKSYEITISFQLIDTSNYIKSSTGFEKNYSDFNLTPLIPQGVRLRHTETRMVNLDDNLRLSKSSKIYITGQVLHATFEVPQSVLDYISETHDFDSTSIEMQFDITYESRELPWFSNGHF